MTKLMMNAIISLDLSKGDIMDKMTIKEFKDKSNIEIIERIRFNDLLTYYKVLMIPQKIVGVEKIIDSLMYMKSTLIAEKLFDMYLSERKEKNRDKYMDDINAIINGKMTVEEMISKRRVTIAQCQDYGLFLRHM